MYYYIIEPPKGPKGIKLLESIKNTLADLGISGETVIPSPARTVEELTQMGIAKGYNTIVAAGEERLIDRVAASLQGIPDVTLGIIPLNPDSLLHSLIGSNNIHSACLILKDHFVRHTDLVLIEPGRYFLTQATIQNEKPLNINFYLDYECKGAALITDLSISNTLNFRLSNNFQKKGLLSNFFGSKKEQASKLANSLFTGYTKIKIETLNPVPVYVDGEIIAKTPVIFKLLPNALKIISKHVKL